MQPFLEYKQMADFNNLSCGLISNDRVTPESRLLIYVLLDKNPSELPFRLSEYDLWHVLRLASSNRVLYLFCLNLAKYEQAKRFPQLNGFCRRIVSEGEKKIAVLRTTLNSVFRAFDEVKLPYLVAKTIWHFPDIPNDIDLMVPPERYREAAEVLGRLQNPLSRHWKSKDDKDLFEGPNFYKIDLHYHFSWLVSMKPFLDPQLAWHQTRTVDYFGIKCPVPNETFDLLANALNIMFERFYITINAYFSMINAFDKTDWRIVFREAERFQWRPALERLLTYLRGIGRAIENDDGKFSKPVRFPYQFPMSDVLKAYWEQWRFRGIFDFRLMPYNLTYSRFKYRISHGESVGIYGDWFPFARFKSYNCCIRRSLLVSEDHGENQANGIENSERTDSV
jgi:hypothetical protein